MSITQSGNRTHDAACNIAEMNRQVATAGASQAAVKAAEITYFRACRDSAIANGVSPVPFLIGLHDLTGSYV